MEKLIEPKRNSGAVRAAATVRMILFCGRLVATWFVYLVPPLSRSLTFDHWRTWCRSWESIESAGVH